MNNTKLNRGFISIELMIALVVIAIATTGGISVLMSYLDGLNEQHAAQQQQQVAKAAEKYLKDNFSTVLASAGATAPAVITVPMLRNTRYLPAGFSDTNIFGQQYQVRARKPAANQLETLIVTTGGRQPRRCRSGGSPSSWALREGTSRKPIPALLRAPPGRWR